LEKVSTTCGSGWGDQCADPPATAGGTDLFQVKLVNLTFLKKRTPA
jgi:hypothetical protein